MNNDVLRKLRNEYAVQSQKGDDKQYITLSRIRYEEGRIEFDNQNYHSAFNLFRDSVSAMNKNLAVLSKFQDEDYKKIYMQKARQFAVEYSAWYIAAFLLDRGAKIDIRDKQSVQKEINKQKLLSLGDFRWGTKDIQSALEQAQILAVGNMRHSLITPTEIVNFISDDGNFTALHRDTVQRLRGRNYHELITQIKYEKQRLSATDAGLLADIYKKLATQHQEHDIFKYQNEMTESLKYSCLASHNMQIFRKRFNNLNEFMAGCDYGISRGESNRKKSLEKVFVLTGGLEIAKSIPEKIQFSEEILELYRKVHHYNANRFVVYKDWLATAHSMLTTIDINKANIDKLHKRLLEMKSMWFKDRDEQWLNTHMPEVVASRLNMQTLLSFLAGLINQEDRLTGSSELNSTLYLYNLGWLDLKTAFLLGKKFIERELELVVSPEPLSAIEERVRPRVDQRHLDQIANGETESVEFKLSWKYDIDTKGANSEVQNSALRTIAAFMNTDGGTLYLGINDEGSIIGLENTEFKIIRTGTPGKKLDKIKLMIDEAIKKFLGKDLVSSVKVINLTDDTGRVYLAIDVLKATKEVYLDNRFYIRGAASNSLLEGQSLVAYCKKRYV